MKVRQLAATASLVVLLGACSDPDRLPPGGGGGGGGGGGNEDAIDAGTDEDASADLAGHVCVVRDLRGPTTCSAFDLTGVSVIAQPGGEATTTDRDGRFSFDDPDGPTRLEVADGDPDLRPSRLDISPWSAPAGVVAPLVTQLRWEEILTAAAAIEVDGDGSLVVYVIDADDGTPVAGAVLDSVIGAGNPPLYGGDDALDWLPGGETGGSGAALVVSVPEGEVTLTAVFGRRDGTVSVPVVAGALSFAVLEL
jgi:hypothetical protein